MTRKPMATPRLRRALDAGVKVVVAHCASLGVDADDDGKTRSSFELFLKLMADRRAQAGLYGDISAITQTLREPAATPAPRSERRELHPRSPDGLHYPLPGVLPLTSLPALVKAGFAAQGGSCRP